MYQHRTEGIVLKNTPYHETSLIVTLITPDRGKLRGLVKGAKRPKSRFGASLEPLTHIEVLFYGKEGRSLNTITQTDIIEGFDAIKRDFDKIAYGAYFLELCDKFVQEGEESQEIFSFLLESLRLLCDWRGDLTLLAAGFGLRFLTLVGFAPSLEQCVVCGAVLKPGKLFFSVDEGGVLCKNCPGTDATELTAYHLRLMRNLSRIPLNRMQRARVKKEVLQETFDLINTYASRRGDTELKSPAFLKATVTN
jgi:DNA repair protein RecO (recombination protein O)